MSYGSDVQSAQGGAVACPLLLECDQRGHIVRMSERTRLALGDPDTLVDTVLSAGPTSGTRPMGFWRVLEDRGVVLLGVQADGKLAAGEADGFAHLKRNLLRRHFQLQNVERKLSARVRQTRRGSGRAALRQIELERERLGRELHTGIGQALAAIRLQVEIVTAQVPDPPPDVQRALSCISLLAADALEQVRSTSRRLHPPEWQRLTLEAALQQLWELSGIPESFEATLRIDVPREPAHEIKVLLYRAAQEALANLTRHSRATRVGIVLEAQADRLVLSITDNGVGFDSAALFSAPADLASGIGLRSVRDQAASLGGQMRVESGAAGTTLEVSAPFEPVEQ